MRTFGRITVWALLVSPIAIASCSEDESNGFGNATGSTAVTNGAGADSASANVGIGGATASVGNASGGATASGGSNVGGSGGLSTGSAGAGGVNAGGAATGGVNAGGGVAGAGGVQLQFGECQGHIYECGNLVDNDGDGLVDSFDPDCLGPCDNTEDGYYGGIPGQAGPACIVDCYFDQDSGSGNDDCHWNHECDPHEVAPNYYPEAWNGNACAYDPQANTPGTPYSCDELYLTQSQACMDYCGPLTPNGCDCFGCCELPSGSGSYVFLGSEDGNGNGSCTLQDISNPSKCEPCLPVAACLNGCGYCEVCIGKPIIPPECFMNGTGGGGGMGVAGMGGANMGGAGGNGGAPPMQCDPGVQPCGQAGQLPCPTQFYCITGCCQESPQ